MRGLPTLHLLDEGFAIQRFPGEDEPKYLVTVIQHRIEARERGRVKTWPRYHLVGPGVRPIQLLYRRKVFECGGQAIHRTDRCLHLPDRNDGSHGK